MKKLLLSSIILLLFSCSILIFQVSCQKEAKANTNNITQQNKIIYIKALPSAGDQNEIWTANIDGTNQQRVAINFPANYALEDDGGSITLTPDNQKIIFAMSVNSIRQVYSCNIDGSNLTKIIEDGAGHYSIVAY
jgi:Tol biopolymer transport system component